MLYYRIRHSVNTKIIGRKYPQVKEVFIPTTWTDPLFIQSFVGKKAPSNVLLPTPILYKGAKLTDLLSAATVGLSLNLLISDKLKGIIERSTFYGVQFFSVMASHLEKEYPFWILHPFNFFFEKLNFEKSVVGYYKDLGSKNLDRNLFLKNYSELESEISNYDIHTGSSNFDGKYLFIEKIVFSELYKADFFSIRCVSGGIGFFISEKLKEQFEKENCTGMVITEPNERYP